MTKYRKRPIEITAVRFHADAPEAAEEFAGACLKVLAPHGGDLAAEVWDYLHQTWVGVRDGDMIACGIKGEFYPIAFDVFESTYEAA